MDKPKNTDAILAVMEERLEQSARNYEMLRQSLAAIEQKLDVFASTKLDKDDFDKHKVENGNSIRLIIKDLDTIKDTMVTTLQFEKYRNAQNLNKIVIAVITSLMTAIVVYEVIDKVFK